MDNLRPVRDDTGAAREAARDPHTWAWSSRSFQTSGTGTAAFWSFLAFSAVCSALTWVVYLRRPAPVPTKAQVGYAEV
ncbi:hypothetical protein GA0115243_1037304 [Streptomyces sp. ScaeMP-e83]|nr:hypothetical protein GA0115243_1037304 [Streptomyces sp. ScaeMP-e83]